MTQPKPTMPSPGRYTLIDIDADTIEDHDVNLGEFCVANDIRPTEAKEIGRLAVGASWHFGGGAAPLFALRREA